MGLLGFEVMGHSLPFKTFKPPLIDTPTSTALPYQTNDNKKSATTHLDVADFFTPLHTDADLLLSICYFNCN